MACLSLKKRNYLNIVNISGGLGNQMFQYAFGKALSINLKQEVYYCIDDLSSYAIARRFELENVFDLNVPIANLRDISNVLGLWRRAPKIRRILARLNNSLLAGPNFITERNFYPSNNLTPSSRGGAYFHGYWQSEDFFKPHEGVILKSFQFREGASNSNQEMMMRIQSGPSIALHIRRGDYISKPKANAMHGVLDVEYYYAAIASVRKRVSNARLFVFTDDHDWARAEMVSKLDNAECVNINNGSDSFRDMQLMSICEHNIVANSSFSWWSAWLNPNPKKIVIAPQKWFSNQSHSDMSLIPASWERM